MDIDAVGAWLKQRGLPFNVRPIDHAQQLKVSSGETVNFYDSGKVVVGGPKTNLRAELDAWKTSGMTPVPTSPAVSTAVGPTEPGPSKVVFVVYGHDEAARDAVELMLLKFGLDPVILANLPASGHTIIEKLEQYLGATGNVGFACVLLTPDDVGSTRDAPEVKPRARQNVILELGMVLARLGRSRVAILTHTDVERPSDIDGLLYLPYESSINEVKMKLFKELREAGYQVDATAL